VTGDARPGRWVADLTKAARATVAWTAIHDLVTSLLVLYIGTLAAAHYRDGLRLALVLAFVVVGVLTAPARVFVVVTTHLAALALAVVFAFLGVLCLCFANFSKKSSCHPGNDPSYDAATRAGLHERTNHIVKISCFHLGKTPSETTTGRFVYTAHPVHMHTSMVPASYPAESSVAFMGSWTAHKERTSVSLCSCAC